LAIGFILEYDGTTMQLPVNPPELVVTRPGNNESADILTLGEVTLIRAPKLAGMVIESYFPKFPDAPAVIKSFEFRSPQNYIDFIEKIRDEKKPARLTVTDTRINMLVTVEDFETKMVAMDEDTHYTLSLKQYRKYGVRVVAPVPAGEDQTVQVAAPEPTRTNVSGAITVGAKVIVNGRLHRDSYGTGPGATKSNFTGVVNFIKTGRSHPYHVTTPGGGWLGWVSAGSVKLA
jgi:hypothetical protein